MLSEPVDKAQNEEKLMPEMNSSTSQEMGSVNNDTLRGEEISCQYKNCMNFESAVNLKPSRFWNFCYVLYAMGNWKQETFPFFSATIYQFLIIRW